MSDRDSKELIRTARRVCFFAHYHQFGIVADHVLYYLRALRESGFAIVVASTATLSEEEAQKLRNACDHLILRENKGLDFGGWIESYQLYPDLNADLLLLTNDSVYGPISNLSTFVDELTKVPADFYGAVECAIIKPHLQSWFLLFRPSVYTSEMFRNRFSTPVEPNLSKQEVVQRYEIGLTHALRESGFTYRAALRGGSQGVLGAVLPYDPGHLLWREMIEGSTIPFLKSDLLRRNLQRVANLGEWRSVVGAKNNELQKMIDGDLAIRGEAVIETFAARLFHSLRSPFQNEWPELQSFLRRDYNTSDKYRYKRLANSVLFHIVRFAARCARKPIRKALSPEAPK